MRERIGWRMRESRLSSGTAWPLNPRNPVPPCGPFLPQPLFGFSGFRCYAFVVYPHKDIGYDVKYPVSRDVHSVGQWCGR